MSKKKKKKKKRLSPEKLIELITKLLLAISAIILAIKELLD